jgi:predicted nucleotidyltransferase
MSDNSNILQLIKQSVITTEPTATVLLYGSYARGQQTSDSDIDLLILIDKDRITPADEDRITYPLYDIEFETGTMISPMLYTRHDWANHQVTPFYENVNSEGKVL